MNHFATVTSLFLIFFFSSCEQNKISGDGLVGYWTYSNYDETDNISIYDRKAKMPTDEYGMCFKSDGSFLELKNAGWCGTPPISYGTFEGSWTQSGDTLFITVGFWGGTEKLTKLINSVDKDHLRLKIIDSVTIYTEEQ